jgi:hypothetical protein
MDTLLKVDVMITQRRFKTDNYMEINYPSGDAEDVTT